LIKARHNALANAIFQPYILWLFRRHFHSLQLLGPVPSLACDEPILLLPNHSSWWDGFFLNFLNQRLLKRALYLMMLNEQLTKNHFFSYLGVFSMDPQNRSHLRRSLHYALQVLQETSSPLLVIFPQGELTPWQYRPFIYRPGVEWLWRKSRRPLTIVPVAIKIEFLQEQRADAFIKLGEPISSTSSPSLENIRQKHEALLNQLNQQIGAGVTGQILVQGKRSVNARVEKIWRR
jgi:1-acyl-sn-glycerol-3-phosphate acyltransferase